MSEAKFWTPEKVRTALKLWDQGVSCTEIGKSFGKSKASVETMANRHRSIFKPRISQRTAPPPLKPSPAKIIRVTEDGKKVSLPRIPTIHGHFEELNKDRQETMF